MNLEKLKENNKIVQENQVVPSVVQMHYYLIEPTVLQNIYDWNKQMKEENVNTRALVRKISSDIERDNTNLKERLPKIISESMEKEFQIMKQKLQDSEEEQTLKFKKVKWKTRCLLRIRLSIAKEYRCYQQYGF